MNLHFAGKMRQHYYVGLVFKTNAKHQARQRLFYKSLFRDSHYEKYIGTIYLKPPKTLEN